MARTVTTLGFDHGHFVRPASLFRRHLGRFLLMADVFTQAKRSAVMSAIRSTGTKPEERLFTLVAELLGPGYPLVRHDRTLPGTPDVVVPALRLALFADGCFFHCCPRHGRIPEDNVDYWGPKLARNVRRDRLQRRKLRAQGYGAWRLWEHDLRSQRAYERTRAVLGRRLERRIALISGA